MNTNHVSKTNCGFCLKMDDSDFRVLNSKPIYIVSFLILIHKWFGLYTGQGRIQVTYILPVVSYDLCLLEYVFSLFILLCFLISPFIFPSQNLTAIGAVNIGNCVQTGH